MFLGAEFLTSRDRYLAFGGMMHMQTAGCDAVLAARWVTGLENRQLLNSVKTFKKSGNCTCTKNTNI